MKRYIVSSFLLLLLSAFFVAACDTDREDETRMDDTDVVVRTETMDRDTVNNFWTYNRDYTYAERSQFEKDYKDARAKLDREIQQLETQAKNATGETKEWYSKRAEELKEKRADLDNDWKNFQKTTEENWEDFKKDVKDGWNDIEDAWNDVEAGVDVDVDANVETK